MSAGVQHRLHLDHWLAPGKLSIARCAAIVSDCERAAREHIYVTHPDEGVERVARDVQAAMVSTPWIFSMACRYAAMANDQCGWQIFVDRVESMYCVYESGQFCGWHTDGYGIELPGQRTRKLSVGIQLSDPADYTGGTFELERVSNNGASEVVRVDAFAPQGSIIAFPGTLVHRITPVTRGIRRSLVIWFTGPITGDDS